MPFHASNMSSLNSAHANEYKKKFTQLHSAYARPEFAQKKKNFRSFDNAPPLRILDETLSFILSTSFSSMIDFTMRLEYLYTQNVAARKLRSFNSIASFEVMKNVRFS